MSKLFNLINSTDWDAVAKVFFKIFPKQKKNKERYETIFFELKNLVPENSDMTLYFNLMSADKDSLVDEDWVDLYFKNGSMRDEDSNIEETFCMDFSPWTEWLGVKIGEEVEKEYTQEEIISYCLYNMTFCGFSQDDIKNQLDELNRRIKEAEEHPERLIPMEDVFKNIKEKIKRK